MPAWDSALMKKYGIIVGVFDGIMPNLYITDVDLIKAVFVKDFDHFVDRRVFFFLQFFFMIYLVFNFFDLVCWF